MRESGTKEHQRPKRVVKRPAKKGYTLLPCAQGAIKYESESVFDCTYHCHKASSGILVGLASCLLFLCLIVMRGRSRKQDTEINLSRRLDQVAQCISSEINSKRFNFIHKFSCYGIGS
jgi:hypothetical protein